MGCSVNGNLYVNQDMAFSKRNDLCLCTQVDIRVTTRQGAWLECAQPFVRDGPITKRAQYDDENSIGLLIAP